jgi:hypothetical protein
MQTDDQLINAALKYDAPPAAVLLQFERLGDRAFDEIRRRLDEGKLPPRRQVFALRRLALLTRQACANRTEELLELALVRLQDESAIVRSGATNTAIWITLGLERNPTRASKAENRPGAKPRLRERIQAEVTRALARGLDPQQEKFARDFLGNKI